MSAPLIEAVRTYTVTPKQLDDMVDDVANLLTVTQAMEQAGVSGEVGRYVGPIIIKVKIGGDT